MTLGRKYNFTNRIMDNFYLEWSAGYCYFSNHCRYFYAVTMPPKKFVGTIRRFAKPPTDVSIEKTGEPDRK